MSTADSLPGLTETTSPAWPFSMLSSTRFEEVERVSCGPAARWKVGFGMRSFRATASADDGGGAGGGAVESGVALLRRRGRSASGGDGGGESSGEGSGEGGGEASK